MENRVSVKPLEGKIIQKYSLLTQKSFECLVQQESQAKTALVTLNHLTYDLYQQFFYAFAIMILSR